MVLLLKHKASTGKTNELQKNNQNIPVWNPVSCALVSRCSKNLLCSRTNKFKFPVTCVCVCAVTHLQCVCVCVCDMYSDGTLYLKSINTTDLHIKYRTVVFFQFLMGFVNFKHGAPKLGKIPHLSRQHEGTSNLDKRSHMCTICHVADTISPILLQTDTGAAHSILSRKCLFQFF